MGSRGCTLGVVGFIRGRWVQAGALWGSFGVFWVHCGAPCRSTGSLWVDVFTRVRSGLHRVHSGSLGSLGCALGTVWFNRVLLGSLRCALAVVGVVGFTQKRPGGRRVHLGCLVSCVRALGVLGFIRGRWVHAGSPWGSSGVIGFTWEVERFIGGLWFRAGAPWGRLVHSGSLCSRGCVLCVIEFIRGYGVHADAT